MLVASSTGLRQNSQHGEATGLTYLATPPSSAQSPITIIAAVSSRCAGGW